MSLLADLIFLVHVAVVAFVVLAPFLATGATLVFAAFAIFCILLHWKLNDSTCCLSLLESKIRGVEKGGTFMNRLVEPIYTPPSDDTVTALTLLLEGVALYRLLKNPKHAKEFIQDIKTVMQRNA